MPPRNRQFSYPLSPFPQMDNPWGIDLPRPQAPNTEPDLTPEDETSLLSGLLSGVQYIGETLDKPGAAVRGLLGGKPEELLNLVPFSDTMGITDPAKRVSGRDLLQQWGVVGRNKPGLDWGDAGGLATEIALDPLTWAAGPLGAFTQVGKAGRAAAGTAKNAAEAVSNLDKAAMAGAGMAKLAETTPIGFAEQLRSGERALFGLKANPLAREADIVFGHTGEGSTAAGKWAANKVADVVEGLTYGTKGPVSKVVGAPIRGVRALFSHTAGASGPAVSEAFGTTQLSKDLAYQEAQNARMALEDAIPALKNAEQSLYQKYKDLAEFHGGQGDQAGFDMFMRDSQELSGLDSEQLARLWQRHANISPDVAPEALVAAVDELKAGGMDAYDKMHGFVNGLHRQIRDYGGNVAILNDKYAEHLHRQVNKSVYVAPGEEFKSISEFARRKKYAMQYQRADVLYQYPGRTAGLIEMSKDPFLAATVARKVEPDAGIAKLLRKNLKEAGVSIPRGSNLDQLRKMYTKLGAKDDAIEEALKLNDEIAAPLRAEVEAMIGEPVPAGMTAADLKRLYFQEKYLRRDIADAMEFGRLPPEGSEAAMKEWDDWLNPSSKQVTRGNKVITKNIPSKTDQMLRYLAGLPEDVMKTGLFDKPVMEDLVFNAEQSLEYLSTLRKVHHYLDAPGMVRRIDDATKAVDAVPVMDAWKNAGLNDMGIRQWAKEHPQFIGQKFEGPAGQKITLYGTQEQIDKQIADMVASGGVAPVPVPQTSEDIEAALKTLYMPAEESKVLKAYTDVAKPHVKNSVLNFIDKYLIAPWKGPLTVMRLGFHTRNMGSALWQEATDGQLGVAKIVQGWTRVGSSLNSVSAKLGVEKSKYLQEAIDMGLFGKGHMAEAFGEAAAQKMVEMPQGIFGGVAEAFKPSSIRAKGWQSINPAAMRGIAEPDAAGKVTQNVLAEAGDRLYNYVETIVRGGYYDALRTEGFSPAQAKYLVERSNFDYSKLSRFEKNVMKRATLFWTFRKKNIPYQLSKLLERPGGGAAQTIRAVNSLRGGRDEYTPSFLREGMAIRTGGTEDQASFIRQAGLPIDDLNQLVMSGWRPSGRTVEKAAASLHPLLTAPLEYWADRQFYTGRRLTDMEPISGIAPLDKAITASPFSGFVSEFRSAVDPRKDIWQKIANATTGTKFSTYDAEKLRLLDLQDAQNRQLAGQPYVRTAETVYIPERFKAQAGPETQRDIKRVRATAKAIKTLKEKRAREGKA